MRAKIKEGFQLGLGIAGAMVALQVLARVVEFIYIAISNRGI